MKLCSWKSVELEQLKKNGMVCNMKVWDRHDSEVTNIQELVEAMGIHKINQMECRDDRLKQEWLENTKIKGKVEKESNEGDRSKSQEKTKGVWRQGSYSLKKMGVNQVLHRRRIRQKPGRVPQTQGSCVPSAIKCERYDSYHRWHKKSNTWIFPYIYVHIYICF